MRTTTTSAWAAALAIMSMRGPFTTAEAAPARQYEADRGRHFFPKHLRRGGYNHTHPGEESSSSPSMSFEPDLGSPDTSSPPPITPEDSTSTNTRRMGSSTQSSQPYDEEALIESLIDAGRLPETANTVVTTTVTVAHNAQRTATYTLTYTETSSPVPGQNPYSAKSKPPVPLTSSSSVPIPAGTAPEVHHHGTKKVTTRGTSTKNIFGSLVPIAPLPLNAASSSPLHIDSRTHRHHNATQEAQPIPASTPPSSSSMVPTSSDDAGLLGGLTDSLLGQGTKPAGQKKPQKTPPTSSSPDGGLLGTDGILGSTGGLVPLIKPTPTPSSQHYVPSDSTSTPTDGGLLVGLSTAIPNILGTKKGSQDKPTKSTDGGLLSDLGLTGLPTGSLPLPVQSVLPTGVLPHGQKGPHDSYSSSKDTGLLGHLTDEVHSVVGTLTDDIKSKPTGLVGTLTDGVDSLKSHATGLVGTLTDGVKSKVPGVVNTLTDGVDSLKSQATGLVGTLTNGVNPAITHATGLVGTLTNGVDTALTHATGLVGTLTNTVDSALTNPTGLVGTVTGVVGTVTNGVDSLTDSLGITTPTGGYTITGGGVTLTVPIPTSVGTDVPITLPSQVTIPTGTGNNGYTITVPTGASSVLSSLSQAIQTAQTVPDTASAYPTSVPLTHSTKLTVGTTPSSYSANDSSAVPATTKSSTVAPETHTKPEHTIKPIGTDSLTSMTFPTSWKFAPTTWSTKTSGLATATESTDTAASGLPTYMPRLVQPPDGMPAAPLNATLIQLGFNYGLNYPFVVGEPDSASQIFQYLPQGIAHGLGISTEHVKMNALMPYDTTGSLRYITTLAQAYIPSQFVETMEMSIHMPLSEIYSNPDAPVKTLMSMINPTIPILPGAAMDGSPSSAWYNPAATSIKGPGAGAPIGGDSGSSNHVRPSTLGIGIGAVGGAAVYAAAMVYVARRYRQKRQNHKRASSVHSGGEMSQRSGGMAGFFMSGANGITGTSSGGRGSRTSAGSSNGRSVREQGISNPIMAENSLGWN